MTEFARIDFGRTVTISGSILVETDEPAFVRLAEEMGRPELRKVATSVGSEFDVVLQPERMRAFSLFAATGAWRDEFEHTLQSISCDDTGDLLTGWMCIDRFVQMVSAAEREDYLVETVAQIRTMLPQWEARNADHVYFDWYVRNK